MRMTDQPEIEVLHNDCLGALSEARENYFDLVYLDPPFFTGKIHRLKSRDLHMSFEFRDLWASHDEYAEFLFNRLRLVHRVLASHGSVFFHCDRNAVHISRLVLDEVFGAAQFRAEIIWQYRRWSNSDRRLLPAHQTILYYSKSDTYKFNVLREPYSPTTNVDQILQRRTRNDAGKSAYERDDDGEPVIGAAKQGVPLGDVWDIPYLNPKAKERTGYPTQKPVLLLERIIRLATDPGDIVLDPFCGSGTTLVAAANLGRRAVGIDISAEAVALAQKRITGGHTTRSAVVDFGREAFRSADEFALSVLGTVDCVPVQRNNGIDAFLKREVLGAPVPVRVQRQGESLLEAARSLANASAGKGAAVSVLVQTGPENFMRLGTHIPESIIVVSSIGHALDVALNKVLREASGA